MKKYNKVSIERPEDIFSMEQPDLHQENPNHNKTIRPVFDFEASTKNNIRFQTIRSQQSIQQDSDQSSSRSNETRADQTINQLRSKSHLVNPSKTRNQVFKGTKEEMESTEYLCMIFCHSIAIKSKIIFDRFLKKIGYRATENSNDKKAAMAFNTVYGLSFSEVTTIYSKNMKTLMSEGLQLSIQRQRATISFDLLAFAKKNLYNLAITENEIQQLLMFDNFQLINLLIGVNSLLLVEEKETGKDDNKIGRQSMKIA